MDVQQFVVMFKDAGVRAWLDWSQIVRPEFQIADVFSRDRELLGNLYTPWYRTVAGTAGDWRNHDDRPVRVCEVIGMMSAWPTERSHLISSYVARFQEDDDPVHLVLPSVVVGRNDILLLDGTHRASAAYVAGCEVRLFIFALTGPLSPEILPDVKHFAGK